MSSITNSEKNTINIPLNKPIIFFDGECNLCNGFVDLMLKIDRDQKFYLAPLQGTTAQQYLPPLPTRPEDWAIAYLEPNHSDNYSSNSSTNPRNYYNASDACLAICAKLGGMWRFFSIFRLLPKKSRDYLYRLVANNRYRWFGKCRCRILPPQQPSSFLP